MNLSQVKKSRKLNQHFSKEHNEFLPHAVAFFIHIQSERKKWQKIFEFFCERYPDFETNVKSLQEHYNNVLNPNLSRTLSEQEEIEVSNLFNEIGFKHREIARRMKKTENCIKNYCHEEFRKKIGEVRFQEMSKIGKKKNKTFPQVRSKEKTSIDSKIDEIRDACLNSEENHFLDIGFSETCHEKQKIQVFEKEINKLPIQSFPQVRPNEKNSIDSDYDEITNSCLSLDEIPYLDYGLIESLLEKEKIPEIEEEVNKLPIQPGIERNLMNQQESFFSENHEFPS
jgi:hypothetical protein